MEKKRARKPFTIKNYTFWTQQRLAKGVTVAALAKEFDVTEGSLQTYFSGEHIPRESVIMQFCNYFGVDKATAKAAFVKDHQIWEERHSSEWHKHDKEREKAYFNKYYYNNSYLVCLNFNRKTDKDLIDKLNTIELGNRCGYIRNLLRKHLGNDNFSTERLTPEVRGVLSVIYTEVPFDIFMKCLETLLDTKTFDVKLLYGYVSYSTFIKIYKLQDKI